ncbi:hypothetical protein GOBAR_AA17602 [Gossypium barbadense]|uniref:Uncharacterized protein n=1 Tax=Gossypium barbadense TaxID=3634 RepID=A0A2P5XIB8_GOSBA|nr:hypothetical protein GOBAR_AA17602 [Gossypium barbadense]
MGEGLQGSCSNIWRDEYERYHTLIAFSLNLIHQSYMESNEYLAPTHGERLAGGPAPARRGRLMGILLRTLGGLREVLYVSHTTVGFHKPGYSKSNNCPIPTHRARVMEVLLQHMGEAYGRYHMLVTLPLVPAN